MYFMCLRSRDVTAWIRHGCHVPFHRRCRGLARVSRRLPAEMVLAPAGVTRNTLGLSFASHERDCVSPKGFAGPTPIFDGVPHTDRSFRIAHLFYFTSISRCSASRVHALRSARQMKGCPKWSKKSAELEIVASMKFMNARREHISISKPFDKPLSEPDTILRCRHQLVAEKWDYIHRRKVKQGRLKAFQMVRYGQLKRNGMQADPVTALLIRFSH